MAALTVRSEAIPAVAEKAATETLENSAINLKSAEVNPTPNTEVTRSRSRESKSTGVSQPAVGGRNTRKKQGSKAKSAEAAIFTRYFLAKPGTNGTPELDREMEDENQAMVEALKRDGTFLILSEWRPKVDNSTQGRAVIEKEAVSRSK
jgi:hypothetical protein